MNKFKYYIELYILIFIICVPKLTYAQINCKEFHIESDEKFVSFKIKKNVQYTINSSGMITHLIINGTKYEVPLAGRNNNAITISLDVDSIITPIFKLSGIWDIDGSITFCQGEQIDAKPLLLLQPEHYSNESFFTQNGYRFDFPDRYENFIIGYFKNNKKIKTDLLKKRYDFFYWFKNTYELRFKAQKESFLMIRPKKPYLEKVKIQGRTIEKAFYLNGGKKFNTKIKVKKGTKINIAWRPSGKQGVEVYVDNIKQGGLWTMSSMGGEHLDQIRTKSEGILFLIPKSDTVITRIDISNN